MIEVNSNKQMQDLGSVLGKTLTGGETIELVGDVGAGKTTFVRGVARGMHVDETVQSPSFTISRIYEATEGRRLVHYDFYRL
ncbi:tRNA (adenosine(37)-N6)-threonylcarbamoyltransferase complex ATPase subunit type 1 TsaE, partial [Candidatus Saccharibacteria bacterium]|nr:tRNA (adenosine(37)-N6)-threonylcarbamoyltransferase complex ATPase subunit type 1 TsaE [Candidatus Saccharibacteria bacterium]